MKRWFVGKVLRAEPINFMGFLKLIYLYDCYRQGLLEPTLFIS